MCTSSAGATFASISRRNATILRAMLRFAAGKDFARGHVQRREQIARAVPNVIMRVSFGLADVHRQDRLRPLERLEQRFLVVRERHRIVRRGHVQTHDIANLLDQLRVRRDLERLADVRFEGQTCARCARWSCGLGPPAPPSCACSNAFRQAAPTPGSSRSRLRHRRRRSSGGAPGRGSS